MTYPPEQQPPSPDAPAVLDALGYVPRRDSVGRVMAPGAHFSDCAIHNEPAFPAGPCDCGAMPPRPDMHVIGPDEYEVAEPGNGRVLAVIVAVVVAALIWWGW